MTTSGINTHVNIDLDGTGGTYSPTNIATIYNETGLERDRRGPAQCAHCAEYSWATRSAPLLYSLSY